MADGWWWTLNEGGRCGDGSLVVWEAAWAARASDRHGRISGLADVIRELQSVETRMRVQSVLGRDHVNATLATVTRRSRQGTINDWVSLNGDVYCVA